MIYEIYEIYEQIVICPMCESLEPPTAASHLRLHFLGLLLQDDSRLLVRLHLVQQERQASSQRAHLIKSIVKSTHERKRWSGWIRSILSGRQLQKGG